MKIIRPGKPEHNEYTGMCRHCRCVFECDVSEGRLTRHAYGDQHLEVYCPECGKGANAFPK